jgi:hypothetical protein
MLYLRTRYQLRVYSFELPAQRHLPANRNGSLAKPMMPKRTLYIHLPSCKWRAHYMYMVKVKLSLCLIN